MSIYFQFPWYGLISFPVNLLLIIEMWGNNVDNLSFISRWKIPDIQCTPSPSFKGSSSELGTIAVKSLFSIRRFYPWLAGIFPGKSTYSRKSQQTLFSFQLKFSSYMCMSFIIWFLSLILNYKQLTSKQALNYAASWKLTVF